MSYDLEDLCTAIHTTLETLIPATLSKVDNYNELHEDFPDCPMAQVYLDSGETDVMSGENDRSTFGAGMRVEETLVVVDIPVTQRSELSEDMQATIKVIQEVQAKLREQKKKPLFGYSELMSFRWRWERVLFQRGESAVVYSGVKFFIYCRGY